MNIINIEIYSLIIALLILIDYKYFFKNNINKRSISLISFIFGTILLSLINILMILLKISVLRLLLLFIAFVIIFCLPIILYDYIKEKYLKTEFFIKNKYYIEEIYFFLTSILIIMIFYINSDRQVPLYITGASYYNKYLVFSIIPMIILLIEYFYYRIYKDKVKNIRIFLIILIHIIGTIIGIIIFTNLNIFTLIYLLCGILLYTDIHDEIINRDRLTGVYNREVLERFTNEKRNNGNKLTAIYMIDVDKFKTINDTYGHHIGDKILIDLAKILTMSVRQSDYIIRYGGDEFLIIAKINEEKNAELIPQKIKDNIINYNNNNQIPISISIGSSIYNPKNKYDFKKLIATADKKMYKTKNKNRN